MNETDRPRVGHIQFLNCLPMYYGLIHHGALGEMNLTKGTPARLNRWLIEGKLDISPISAIEYARNASDLLLLPDISVGSDGEVKSILLASKEPIEKLGGRSIALADTSRTSQLLLKMILKDKYGLEATYRELPPDLDRMLAQADAALLIGDPALRALWKQNNDLFLYDLGAEWKSYTGRRMVYALWAVRRDYYEKWPDRVAAVYKYFLDSMAYSVLHIDRIAAETAPERQFDAAFLANYFLTLRFDLHAGYKRDFLVFLSKAKELGYLDEVPEMEFIEDSRQAAEARIS
jgi:chorismate dehydratase